MPASPAVAATRKRKAEGEAAQTGGKRGGGRGKSFGRGRGKGSGRGGAGQGGVGRGKGRGRGSQGGRGGNGATGRGARNARSPRTPRKSGAAIPQSYVERMAARHWQGGKAEGKTANAELIESIYDNILSAPSAGRRVSMQQSALELSGYLEHYLWPLYEQKACEAPPQTLSSSSRRFYV
eukprot:2087005-Pleurochrysis_carterae.AAC.3